MKTTIKLFLIVSMFCATAFADGNQGSGGYKCENGEPTCPPPCTENCGGNCATSAPDDEYTTVDIITDIAEEIYLLVL